MAMKEQIFRVKKLEREHCTECKQQTVRVIGANYQLAAPVLIFEGADAQKNTTKPKDTQILEAGTEILHSRAGVERVAIFPNWTVQFP